MAAVLAILGCTVGMSQAKLWTYPDPHPNNRGFSSPSPAAAVRRLVLDEFGARDSIRSISGVGTRTVGVLRRGKPRLPLSFSCCKKAVEMADEKEVEAARPGRLPAGIESENGICVRDLGPKALEVSRRR